MDSFPIYGQLSIDYGQLSIVWTLSIWTLSMHGQKTVHAWTAQILSIMDTVHTMDNLFLVHVHVHYTDLFQAEVGAGRTMCRQTQARNLLLGSYFRVVTLVSIYFSC